MPVYNILLGEVEASPFWICPDRNNNKSPETIWEERQLCAVALNTRRAAIYTGKGIQRIKVGEMTLAYQDKAIIPLAHPFFR